MPAVTLTSLRSYQENDLEFLYRVYAASRAEEMALVQHWDEGQKEAFLRFQFKAQHKHYHEHYPNARYDIIVSSGENIGRLYVDRAETDIRLMDIALLPGFRGRGIGSGLIRELQDEARQSNKTLSLHVEESNPAYALYLRMGFTQAGELSFYKRLHWTP